MSLGEFTKQLAKEAIGNQMKDVMGGLRPTDAAAKAEAIGALANTSEDAGGNLAAILIGQVQAMQKALREDQELIVLCTCGFETLRVLEIFSPAPKVLVLTGIDAEQNTTRIVSPADAVQLVCKLMVVQPGTKAARIRFVLPRPKPE